MVEGEKKRKITLSNTRGLEFFIKKEKNYFKKYIANGFVNELIFKNFIH